MKRIVIDPGHGGTDRYNRGPTGYVEADGVLTISKYLRDELLKTGQFEVKLTRETDMTVDLTTRSKIAIAFGADLFISEHTNATGLANSTRRGCEVFESVDLADEVLAGKMSAAISAAIGTPNLGAKSRESTNYPGEDYYSVIDGTQDGGIKHVLLVESAFHDNVTDEAILKVDANLKKIAVAQAKVICELFGVQYPPVVLPPNPTIKMTTPANCTVIAGTTITVTGTGTNCDHIGAFVNGVYKSSQSGNNFNDGIVFTNAGSYTVDLRGRNTKLPTDPGSVLVISNSAVVKVLAATVAVPTTELAKVNEAIKTLQKYIKL